MTGLFRAHGDERRSRGSASHNACSPMENSGGYGWSGNEGCVPAVGYVHVDVKNGNHR